ncbi:hypothetical protein GQ55_6G125800 [Panicum hallii var. hallii]|uniref:Uncharacterized protein n=1 Tax=Panicum hallii var. hallii TaxID=1504633 RepID=A0A2T7D5Y6_9POAL|nr:hypothetical protein GQ55_6G125800 [Panicum hallii var. hallii]
MLKWMERWREPCGAAARGSCHRRGCRRRPDSSRSFTPPQPSRECRAPRYRSCRGIWRSHARRLEHRSSTPVTEPIVREAGIAPPRSRPSRRVYTSSH